MVTVKFKPKPKPDFDYRKIPYSGRDVTNPFVKTNPYWTKDTSGNNVKFFRDEPKYNKGQDFYPDRMYRDERTAQRQFFNSPAFQQSDVGGIFKDFKGMDLKNERDTFINFLNEFQLRQQPRYNFNTKKYDGPMEREGATMDYDPRTYNYLSGLDEARQNQFAKYSPFYGLSDEMIEDMYTEDIDDIRKKRTEDKGYGWERPVGNTEEFPYLTSKYKDVERGLGAGFLEGAGLFTDLGGNIIKNLYPYDEKSLTGQTIPKGLIDTGMYQWKKSEFENEIKEELGIDLAEAWLNLPKKERDALNADFKERSGYDYDPDLNPWWFEEAPTRDFSDWAFYEPADDIRSRIFLEDWDTIDVPWFEKFGGDIETSYTWPEIADVGTEFTAGWYAPSKILGKAQSFASSPLAKKLQKIPGVGKLLSKFTGPKSQTSGIIGLGAWLDALEGE